MIRKLASGLYTWLPMGVRVLNKVEAIVREEMNRSGALEVFMPVTQPASLWKSQAVTCNTAPSFYVLTIVMIIPLYLGQLMKKSLPTWLALN